MPHYNFLPTLSICFLLHFTLAGPTQKPPTNLSTFSYFQLIVQTATEEAIEQLHLRQDNEESILADLTSQISDATTTVIASLLQQQNSQKLDVKQVASSISLAVESALLLVQRSINQPFDIDSVVISIYEDMQDILKYVVEEGEEVGSETLQDKIVVSIQRVFGQNLIQGYSIDNQQIIEDVGFDNQSIIQLLNLEDIEGAKRVIETLLKQSNETEVAQAIQVSLSDDKLLSILTETMVSIYEDGNFPITQLSDALALTKLSKGDNSLAKLLGNVIAELKDAKSNQGMVEAIAMAFSSQIDDQNIFVRALKFAIAKHGCTVAAQILLKAKSLADQNKFDINVQLDDDVSECMVVGEGLSLTVKVLGLLDEPEEAYALLSEAAEKQQEAAIATSVIEGFYEGKEEEVITTLGLLFSDASLSSRQLSLIVSLILSAENEEVAQAILLAIERLGNDNLGNVADTVFYSLVNGQPQIKQAFEQFLELSISKGSCRLSPVVKAALNQISKQEANQLLQVFVENPQIQSCVNYTLLAAFSSPNPPSSRGTSFIVPTPTMPSAVPEKLQVSPLSLEPLQEALVLSFSTSLDSLNETIVDENTAVLKEEEKEEEQQQVVDSLSSNTQEECVDVTPPGSFSCKQQVAFGKCSRVWMTSGGYCRLSCGVCTASTPPPTLLSPPIISPSPSSPSQIEAEPFSTQEETRCQQLTEELLLKVAKLAVAEVLAIQSE